MNDVQLLYQRLFAELPQFGVTITPATEDEHKLYDVEDHWWQINVGGGKQEVGIEWKTEEGFCIYIGKNLEFPFVTPPDFTHPDVESAFQKVIELVTT